MQGLPLLHRLEVSQQAALATFSATLRSSIMTANTKSIRRAKIVVTRIAIVSRLSEQSRSSKDKMSFLLILCSHLAKTRGACHAGKPTADFHADFPPPRVAMRLG